MLICEIIEVVMEELSCAVGDTTVGFDGPVEGADPRAPEAEELLAVGAGFLLLAAARFAQVFTAIWNP